MTAVAMKSARWTVVQLALWAYCAKTAGWLLSSMPLGWNAAATVRAMKPAIRRAADRRSPQRSPVMPGWVLHVWLSFAIGISLLLSLNDAQRCVLLKSCGDRDGGSDARLGTSWDQDIGKKS